MFRRFLICAALVLVSLTMFVNSSSGSGLGPEPVPEAVPQELLPESVPLSNIMGDPLRNALEGAVSDWVAARQEWEWYAEVARQEAARIAAEKRRSARPAQPVVQYGSGACGGDLPPCSVMMCESGGNIRAENGGSWEAGSTASGKWQFVDGTWNGYGGYQHASHAPESVQDERARQVYDGGAGRHHWVC